MVSGGTCPCYSILAGSRKLNFVFLLRETSPTLNGVEQPQHSSSLPSGAPDRQESLACPVAAGDGPGAEGGRGTSPVAPAGPTCRELGSEDICVGRRFGFLAPHMLSAACPSAVCTAERGSRVRAENPRALGLASRGSRSRCCHGERAENGSGKGLGELRAGRPGCGAQALSHPPGDGVLVPRPRCLACASGLPARSGDGKLGLGQGPGPGPP